MRPTGTVLLVLAALATLAATPASRGQDPKAPATAPKDRPVTVVAEQYQDFILACEPSVKKARATYPAAKDRYLAGLPPGQRFFVTARLVDGAGQMEQVFVAVDRIVGGVVEGRISSEISLVAGFKERDEIRVPEGELIDWLIAKPDGTEEGNFVGKFLDNYVPGKKSGRTPLAAERSGDALAVQALRNLLRREAPDENSRKMRTTISASLGSTSRSPVASSPPCIERTTR
jgi:hypothetical protein